MTPRPSRPSPGWATPQPDDVTEDEFGPVRVVERSARSALLAPGPFSSPRRFRRRTAAARDANLVGLFAGAAASRFEGHTNELARVGSDPPARCAPIRTVRSPKSVELRHRLGGHRRGNGARSDVDVLKGTSFAGPTRQRLDEGTPPPVPANRAHPTILRRLSTRGPVAQSTWAADRASPPTQRVRPRCRRELTTPKMRPVPCSGGRLVRRDGRGCGGGRAWGVGAP